MVEVFKTNVQRKEQRNQLLSVLSETFPLLRINLDLSDCDKVLRVEGDAMEPMEIVVLVKEYGFTCEVME